ncbi:2-hydroxyacid dehydrogenase [Roseomonas elaeocarpi]|uniref:2-hydroxyacid dehydrogenase n=1 Tax=Roseomonas elaeocarpi TaxID=907779 RepID=A0ABV6JRJ3_9PROT
MVPLIILVKSGGEESLPGWREDFRAVDPRLDVRWWDDPTVAAEDVHYVLVWDPEHGRLKNYPNLRVIFSSAAGVDNIVGDPEWPAHLPLVRMGGTETARRMAEFVSWCCLSLLRGARRMALGQEQAHWDHFQTSSTAPERRVGIMGMGNLGAATARMLGAIGFPVSGWSRSRKEVPGVRSFAGAEEMDAFLQETDILVCLLPSTPETVGIINRDLLNRMPRGAQVVNVGRGSHLVMDDLLAALDDGQIDSAVLDVFEREPLPDNHPLWRHPKITVTPHLASLASRRERVRYVAEAIASHEGGGTLPNLFDAKRGY